MAGSHNETILEYCNKVDIENYLLLDIDSSFDTQINTWIAAAEKHVNNYLGYTTNSGVLNEQITSEKANAYVDTEGNLMVFPNKTPINSVSSLSLIKGTNSLDLSLTSGDDTRYNIPTGGKYLLYPGTELSMTGNSIIGSFFDIRGTKFFTDLDYIAGYTEVPYPIRQATVNIASDFIMRHTNKEDLEGITQGRISKRWSQRLGGESDFMKDAYELLRPYRQSARWV